ncbi:LysR substrate-binding domain-containing protein [Paenibacillus glacialis]|uniref:LysR substrate-binding domain-containing protein n=1 Tax=Paenibacillus glacialis TaxID=494026 RepID=UPI001FE033F6|nr:LysR substrate-binding domain-containing protein [Paenibacillus glacialis]
MVDCQDKFAKFIFYLCFLDIGIISTGSFHKDPLRAYALCMDELVLACSPTHPFAESEEWTPELIAASSFVLHGRASSTRRITDQWLEQHGISPFSRLELDSLEAIKQAVMLGEHISFISRMAVQSEADRGLLRIWPIPGLPAERQVYAITNQDGYMSSTSSRFIEILNEWSRSIQEPLLEDQE